VVNSVPFMVYGPGQQEGKLLPYVVRSLLEGRAPEIGSGDRRADWVYAGDVAEGLVACGFEPGALGRKLDLGAGVLTPVRSVVELVREILGSRIEPRYGALPPRPHEPERIADVATAREILGWSASTSLREGLARTIDALRGSMGR
jgi:nucleoside-diphosphate-sugar epimerase